MVAIAGIALQHLSIWALLLLVVVWALQFQHMKYEEQVLFQSFPDYADYMARTARFGAGRVLVAYEAARSSLTNSSLAL